MQIFVEKAVTTNSQRKKTSEHECFLGWVSTWLHCNTVQCQSVQLIVYDFESHWKVC